MTPERRMTLTAAIAVVFVSTVIFPLFSGTTWFYAGIGAVITVAAFGALSRLRTLPPVLCLLTTLIGLLLYLNLAFEASRSLIGVIPTPASLSELGRLLKTGMDEASKYAPGAPNVKGLVLLAAGGVGITAVFTDFIAVRMKSTALAGLPLLVLFTVPVTMSTTRGPVATIVIFSFGTSGYLAMLSADGRERIRVWGRLVSLWRSHEDTTRTAEAMIAANGDSPAQARPPARPAYRVLRGPDTSALAAAGRRVGLASVVLALCAPLLVPGLHASRLLASDWEFGGGSGAGTVTLPDPLAGTATQLRESRQRTVLTYSTNASSFLQSYYPQYLQQFVYDELTDSSSSPWQGFVGTRTQTFATNLPREAGLTNTGTAPETTTSITIAPGAQNSSGVSFLPVPFPPVKITGERGTWRVEPNTLMLVTNNGSVAGQSYTVVSRDVDPTDKQLSQATATSPNPLDTQVPGDYAQSALIRLAKQHTAGAKTTFAQARALESWLSGSSFTYSLYEPAIGSADGLLEFLTRTKSGDCVQFSYAFAVLARLLGIPTRLATGYTAGTPTTTPNHYVVRNTDAHAWPEVFFQGYGWVRFEPTPAGQGTAQAPGYSGSGIARTPPVLPSGTSTTVPSQGAGPGGKIKSITNQGNNIGGALGSKPSAGTPWTAILLAVLAAIALAIGVITIAAPTAARALSSRAEGARQRGTLGVTAALVAIVAAGIVALALYRLMSRTSGLNLRTGWATVGIAFGAAGAFALAVPTVCRLVLRRWRWMRAGDDAGRAHAAWYELRADLADYGVSYLPSDSPRALAGRVASKLALPEQTVEAVSRIALAEERATYAARPTAADTLREDGTTARRGIAAASGRGARWRSRIFPASVMSIIADAAIRVAESWTNRTWLRRTPGL